MEEILKHLIYNLGVTFNELHEILQYVDDSKEWDKIYEQTENLDAVIRGLKDVLK